jgi:O-antigen/teichoic acid export membrane protein
MAAGGLAFFAATAAVNLSNFVFHVAVSRLLGPSDYGALNSLLNVMLVLSVPLGALQAAVTQAEARARATGGGVGLRRLFWLAGLWSLVATVVLVGLSPEIKSFLHFSSPWSILILSGWIVPSALGAVLQGVLMGRLRFAPVAYAMAGGTGVGRLAIGVALVAVGFGVEGAVAASVIGQVVTTVALVSLLRHELSGSGDKQKVAIGARQALLSLVALGGYAVLMSMDTVLARHYLPPREAGWYTAAATAGKIALFLPGAAATLAFPRFSVGDGRSREAGSALRVALLATFALGLLAAVIMVAFSGFVVSLLFGASYAGADGSVGILGLEAMLLGLVGLFVYFHLARRSSASLFSWGGAALAVVAIVFFHHGPEAIAVDMLAAVGATLVFALAGAARVVPGKAKLRSASVGIDFDGTPTSLPDLDHIGDFPECRLGVGVREADVSVIIPFKQLNDYAREAVSHVQAKFPQCTVILVPDGQDSAPVPGTLSIPSAPVISPGGKRDMAARLAPGEVLAFLDDDAYPDEGWLARALAHFDDPTVAAVGGPGVTPPSDNRRQRASGWVLASALTSAGYTYRYRPGRRRDVDDYPSMNLLVRKSDFEAVGGFATHYWPGEDSELCRKLTLHLGKRIVYEPTAVVYHHRRPVLSAHLRQQARYGLHRGHFARRFEGNSRSLPYLLPTLFVLGLFFGPLTALTSAIALFAYGIVLALYAAAVVSTSVWVYHHERDVRTAGLAAIGIVATHVVYGVAYLRGLLTRNLPR